VNSTYIRLYGATIKKYKYEAQVVTGSSTPKQQIFKKKNKNKRRIRIYTTEVCV